MADLNGDQFQAVFSQMDHMDKQYPASIPEEHKNATFHHGTIHAIKDGMVRPANDADKNVSEYSMGDPGDLSEGDHAFAIRNREGYAWYAAKNFHPSLRRARVYEVEPAHDMVPGPHNKEHPDFVLHHQDEIGTPDDYPTHEAYQYQVEDARASHHQDEWASPTGFKVKNRLDIQPGHQGTFPGISWGRYSEHPYNQRVNHPSDDDVQYGTTNSLEDVHRHALKEHAAVEEFRQPPRRRTGAALKAFLRGEPEPPPMHDHPTLF